MASDDDEYQFVYTEDEPPTTALIGALATCYGVEATDLPPLQETLPCEALDRLLTDGDDITVTFPYEDWHVTVSEESIVIRPRTGLR